MQKKSKALFISIEGGEGAGKTTLIKKCEEFLLQNNYLLVVTREPGGTKFSEHIRTLLLQHSRNVKLSNRSELCLFLAARAQHVHEVIKPALKENKIIICDRYSDSSIAYQGYARGLGMEAVENFCNFASDNINPDLTIYLDIDPRKGLERVKNENKYDRIESEKIAFHEKVRKGFHLIAKKKKNKFFIIDANKSKDAIFDETKQILKRFNVF